MPQASKTFRIFVSSTFSDLKAERNALQEHVFPRLRELCAQHGCMFQAIDLRWGIRNEAALDQQTMMICLEEIARCQKVTPRPNFIVLLGDRYGWRPLPAEIPAAEFEEILDGIESRIDRNLLKRWYRRDDNAVPAAYLLQPRDGEYESPSKWESIEHQLRTILLDGIEKVALLETETLKYIRSATEQEIISGLFNVPDAHQHVFCFFRKIIDYEHLSALGDIGRDFCDSFEPHGPGHGYLLDLKRRLRRKLGRNIHEYDAEWSKGRLSQAHIGTLPASLDECLNLNTDGRRSPSLCEDVWRQLSRVILDEIARLKDQDALESEASEHAAFGAERTKHFVGREDFLQKATGYLGGASREPLVVFGASGSGKSAFMARAASDARRRFPNAVVVTRFIGATPASSDGQALLAGVCQEISRRVGPGAGETSVDLENLSEELLKRLSLATRDKPIIVFLDALDQLSSAYNARSLRWLPSSLPPGARVVVSTTPGDCLTALEKKVSRDSLTELQPMSLDDGGKLLDRWLKDAGRTLQPGQRQDVLEGFARNGLPLYLKLAFEEARRWPSFRSRAKLKRDVPGLLGDMFRRLEEHHGKVLVAHGLGYLATARNGLTEDELLDLLARDREFYEDFEANAHHDLPKARGQFKVPVVVWARLYLDLEPYLTERNADGTSLLSFYHRQVNEAVVENYLAGTVKRHRHCSLAAYFGEQDLKSEKGGRQLPNVRKVAELTYHQTHGELWDDLEHCLCDLDFIEAKCAAGRAYDLAADYNAALTAKGFKRERHPAVEEFGRFVRSQSRTLAARPGLVYQQAANEPDRSSPARSAAARWRREAEEPWLRLLNKTGKGSHHLMRLVGHSSAVDGCSFSPDGHKILSASWDGTLKLWDAGTGEELVTMGDTSFHDHPVAAAFEPGGTRILSAHSEGRVRLWDSASGAELSSVIGKWREVLTCGFIEGRERFIALSRPLGWFLKLRDAQTGESLIRLRSFGRKVRISALSPDGSLIASASHKRLNLWNARSGKRVFVRGRFRDRIENCGFSGDGTRVFASDKNEARIWDTSSGSELSTLGKVRNMALSPDGKRAVAFKYSEIDLCYTANGKKLAALRGHTEWVRACAFSPDGKRFVSASNDNTVMVWEAMSRPRDRVTIEREPEAFVDPSDLGFRKRMHTTPALDPLFWDGLTGGKKRTERLSFSSYSYNTKLFSPDSTRVALISNDDAALWDARLDKKICDLATRKGKLVCACFSLDGRLLVTGSQDHTLKIWDSSTGAKLRTLSGHTFWVDDCVFALDGSRIISISTDGTRMWDPGSGRELTNFGDRVHALSPDGQCALTSAYEYNSSSDRETVSEQVARTLIRVKICDLVSGRVITSFPEPWGEIEEAAFSPDGKWILAACRDEPVTLRDASTGRVLCEYPTSCERVQWAPDGKRFIAVSRNSSDLFQVENLSPGPLIVTAWVDPSTGSCAAGCPVCRRWPEVAVADAGCETECSHCHQSLLLNRFLIRADWQSVAAAWQTTNPKKLTRSARS